MGLQKTIDEAAPDIALKSETAEYIARMAGELRQLATKSELGFLTYLLGMVEEEASRQGTRPPT